MKYLFDQLERGAGLRTLAPIMAGLVVLEFTRAGLQAWLGVLSWDVRLGVEYTVREQRSWASSIRCRSPSIRARASAAR